jgi:hypothetical protein
MKNRLKATIYPLRSIHPDDLVSMHRILEKYYYNADVNTFLRDLNKKDGAVIIRKRDTKEVVGFTTYVKVDIEHKGKKVSALFTGDTIIEKEFWGDTALQLAAVRVALSTLFRSPRTPLYWFLITKGYKTYLLMANNFPSYFPRYDREFDPDTKEILHALCTKLFPGYYDEGTGLIGFGDSYQKLKDNVTDISDEMKAKYPKIAFFEKLNPTWREGTELPCIGEVTLTMVLSNAFKFISRTLINPRKG